MGSFIDITGRRFGRLLVTRLAPKRGKHIAWLCVCSCGDTCVKIATNLARGRTTHCGCENRGKLVASITTHGMSGTPMYTVWKGMRQRCNDPSLANYADYGGRGISYDPKWEDFAEFHRDMRKGYSPGLSLERKNNGKGYSKENCKWASRKEQGRNKRNNVRGVVQGRRMALSEAVELFGVVSYSLAWTRMRNMGWSMERAAKTPPRGTSRATNPQPFADGSSMDLVDEAKLAFSKRLMTTVP